MLPSPGRDVVALFGLPFDLGNLPTITGQLTEAARARKPTWLSTANLDWLLMARERADFRRTILDSGLVTMDGAPVAKLARIAGVTSAERVTGADLFDALGGTPADPPLRVFFFGGREGAAERATAKLAEGRPGLTPVGWHNPGFGSVEEMSDDGVIAAINDSRADLLVVSLGAGKGQDWIARNRPRLNVPVVSHLGAVVDFAAGTIDRAPRSFQRLGAEWVWRIGQDRALATRYARDAALIPGLLADAVTIRRLAAPLDASQDGQVSSTTQGVTVSGGTPAASDLATALSGHDGETRVVLTPTAAPSLRTLGTLLLSREAARRRGASWHMETTTPAQARLCALTLGPSLAV